MHYIKKSLVQKQVFISNQKLTFSFKNNESHKTKLTSKKISQYVYSNYSLFAYSDEMSRLNLMTYLIKLIFMFLFLIIHTLPLISIYI